MKQVQMEDQRIVFVNLPERGNYPEQPMLRWMVAGSAAMNAALRLAKGDFITHLDDDDEFPQDRIARLVNFIKETRADLVWHPVWYERPNGTWGLRQCMRFACGGVTTSSVFYHKWFRRIEWDLQAYRYYEPGDWNRFRKIRFLGARLQRYPEALLKHYKQMTQLESEIRPD